MGGPGAVIGGVRMHDLSRCGFNGKVRSLPERRVFKIRCLGIAIPDSDSFGLGPPHIVTCKWLSVIRRACFFAKCICSSRVFSSDRAYCILLFSFGDRRKLLGVLTKNSQEPKN